MRTTVDLPDDLLRRTKAAAALRGMKLKDLIASFIERGLGQPGVGPDRPAEKRKLPSAVRQATGIPIPAMRNEEVEGILTDEEARNAS